MIRGLAVFGILLMNIHGYGLVSTAYDNPFYQGGLTPLDTAIWTLEHYLIEGRAMSIFAILFGAGIVLSTRRRDAAGLPGWGHFYRRYGLLLGIGLIHAYLIWYGDILVAYALAAFGVYLLRRKPVWLQWTLGLAALIGSVWLYLTISELLFSIPEASVYYEDYWWPTAESIGHEIATVRGPWTGWFLHNGEIALAMHCFIYPTGTLIYCGSMMLIGMALLRSGFFEGDWKSRAYLIGAVIGILGGLACTTPPNPRPDEFHYSSMLRLFLGEVSGPSMGFGYLCLLMLLMRNGRRVPVLDAFAPAGRMALTLYLMQSVICGFIFNGYGLGYFETFNRAGLLLIAIGVIAFQFVFARIWFKHFRFGPLEWLWRRLSYGRLS